MLPPRALGTITHIAEKGSYAVNVRPQHGYIFLVFNHFH